MSEGTVTYRGVEGAEYDVAVTVGIDQSGRVVVDELRIMRRPGGINLSARQLQNLKPAFWMKDAIRRLSAPVGPDGSVDILGGFTGEVDADPRVLNAASARRGSTGQREGMAREVELAAQAHKAAPVGQATQRVALALGVTASVARKRIMQARRAGLLDPSPHPRSR